MNNRQISEQAGVDQDVYTWNQIQLERFAELVRQDEREKSAKRYHEIMRDVVTEAIAKEREACVKLCEEIGRQTAAAIRGRTE